jgi:hypothetical protein
MSTLEIINELKKLSLEDKVIIAKSLEEIIEEETSNFAIDQSTLNIILERQEQYKSGKSSSRPWTEIKKELSQKNKPF